mgnify:CR=1 FL=1
MTPTPLPPPRVVTRAVAYPPDAGRLLEHLARTRLVGTVGGPGARPVDTVLLESVDTATKASRTTIAVLQASTRLTCEGDAVTVEVLPQARADGAASLEALATRLPAHVTARTPERLTLSVPPAPDDGSLEERERLTAPSTIEPLRLLAAREVDHPHLPLVAGVFAFDYLATFESLPAVPTGGNTCPDYLFYEARIILVVDHPTRSATLVGASVDGADLEARVEELVQAVTAFASLPGPATPSGRAPAPELAHSGPERPEPEHSGPERPGCGPGRPAPVLEARPTVGEADFEAVVRTMQEAISAGEVYQVVPSRGFTLPCPDALAAYHELREANPSPYMFYLATPGFELLGASPESALLHSARTGEVSIRPIAGTRPRGLGPEGGVDHERDTRLELELRTDAKEVAEHVMLVDLARNDVARVSVPGTRRVTDLMRVDRYSRVMHLVSEVTGTLAPDLDALDAFRASMTMGTLTGAPKLRAAELVRALEGERRGSYGGSVGYLRGDGELDTCIVIRSAFVADGRALVQAGAGVVADSVPAAEAAETVHKARAVLEAVARSQGAVLGIGHRAPSKDPTPAGDDVVGSPTGAGTGCHEATPGPRTPSPTAGAHGPRPAAPTTSTAPRRTGSTPDPHGPRTRVVLLDNRDSFVYNLVDLIATLGMQVEVYRSSAPAATVRSALEPTPAERERGQRPVLCLSPGPGHPRDSGCLMELVRAAVATSSVPTVGICLGFQAIVEACGGRVGPVGPVHGRSTRVEVTAAGRADAALAPLAGGPLDVARYHSLGTRALPADLTALAATTDGVVMAARHVDAPVVGLQFHPESVLTPHGPAILKALVTDLAAPVNDATAPSTRSTL